jgi:HEAT repeat protein
MTTNTSITEQLLQQLQSDDMAIRHSAVKSIRDFPNDAFVDPLIELLSDANDDEVRLSVIKTLGILGDPRTFEHLEVLANDQNIVIRATAIAALGNLQDERAFKHFAKGINDPSLDIRHASVKALRKFKSKESIELLRLALKDVYVKVRRSAIDGLVEINGITADKLNVFDDEDFNVRRTVIDNTERLQDEFVLELLVSALNDEDGLIRRSAARQIGDRLGGLGDANLALEPLIKLMQSDEEIAVRKQAVWALGCIGDVRAIQHLIPIAQNDSVYSVRSMAQSALGWIRDSAATEGLIPLLQDEDDNVRFNVIEALTKIQDERAVSHVGLLLDDEAYNVRREAAKCLRKIGNKEAFVVLANALPYNPNLVFRAIRDWTGELPDGKSKAKYILQDVFANSNNTSFQFRPNLVFAAMLPAVQEQTDEQFELSRLDLTNTLIEEALLRKNDSRMVSIIADLICFGAPGRDKAASLVEQYQKDFSVPASDFDLLRKYIGGERALEPILAQLRTNLDEHFLEPIDSLNKTTFEMWDDTVKQAKRGFYIRLYMSVVIFVLGLVASSIAIYQLSFGNIDRAVLFLGPGVTLFVGLASIVATFYTGPLREIEKSVTDLGIIHTVFIGYIHTVLEISQTFAALVLQQKIDFSEMKKSNDLIKETMTHTLGLLRPEFKQKLEKTIDDKISGIQ